MSNFKQYGLYDYQIEAAEATNNHNKGIVVMPTGTGKTFVQASIIAEDIKNNPGFRMYVVNAPRIMLSYQLLEEVFKFNIDNNIDARYMG
jgi:superfamily II DNA or RNA helicase